MSDEKINSHHHKIIMDSRRNLSITGVTDIDSFDEQMVAVFTDVGELIVRGSGLHIGKIDVDSGELILDGDIESLEYTDTISSGGSFISRLFR